MGKIAGIARGALVVLGLSAVVACDDDDPAGPAPLTAEDLVGSYTATTFTLTIAGAVTDQLALGASFNLTLAADGSTSGRLFVPEGGDDSDLDENLAGTWTFDAASRDVMFDMTADTFVRDATFTAERSGASVRLESSETFGTATIDVVLERT